MGDCCGLFAEKMEGIAKKEEKRKCRKATKEARKSRGIFGQFSEYISLHAKYMYAKMKIRVRV